MLLMKLKDFLIIINIININILYRVSLLVTRPLLTDFKKIFFTIVVFILSFYTHC